MGEMHSGGIAINMQISFITKDIRYHFRITE